MLESIKETISFLRNEIGDEPETGIVLGTGLGGLVNDIEIEASIPYSDIPNFPESTVEGHTGELIFGHLGGKKVVAMKGRFHFYEGYTMQEVTFPIRVMKYMGVRQLFLSNASGGVNPDFEIGTMMILNDHINLFPTNPLIGKHYPAFGERFPDMSEPYDHELIAKAKAIATRNNIEVAEGIYAGLSGPCLETPAEYQYVRNIGADAVGMSTVPECIVARQMLMPVFAMSIITDLGVPGKIEKVTHADVQAAAAKVEPSMTSIMKQLIAES